MRSLSSVATLLLATALLITGQGLQTSLIPLRGALEGFNAASLGFLGTTYFFGFVLGCLGAPYMVRRAGHIRAYAALTGLVSAAPLLHGLFVTELAWFLMRMLSGFCFAGLFMIIESWLNERSEDSARGRTMAVYAIVNLLALVAGQTLLGFSMPETFTLFAIASALMSLAVVPIALTAVVQPPPISRVRLRIGHLYRISPAGLSGALGIGLANGVFWTLGAVYAQSLGLDIRQIAAFISAAIIGGAIAQWPAGRLSDLIDRRLVIAGLSAVAVLASLGLIAIGLMPDFDPARHFGLILGAAALFGATTLPTYALCVAHTSDHADREAFLEVSGTLLLSWSIGASIGPLLASAVTGAVGIVYMFAFIAVIELLVVAFIGWRIVLYPSLRAEDKDAFVSVPRTTPEMYTFDPRIDEETATPVVDDSGEASEPAQHFENQHFERAERGQEADDTEEGKVVIGPRNTADVNA